MRRHEFTTNHTGQRVRLCGLHRRAGSQGTIIEWGESSVQHPTKYVKVRLDDETEVWVLRWADWELV